MLLWVKRRTSAAPLPAIHAFGLLAILIAVCVQIFGRAASTPNSTEGNAADVTHPPICGRLDDVQVHIPPDWAAFTPPALGQNYIDPVYGCNVRRLTDAGAEETLADGKHLSFMHYYSTFSPVNATDTMVLITASDGTWRIISIEGKVIASSNRMPAMNNGHPVWDGSDGSVFYYTLGKGLYRGTVTGNSVKGMALHSFEEYRGIVSPDAADLSQDGDHIALIGQNRDNTMDIFVWSLRAQAKTSIYHTACTIGSWNVTATPQPGCVHKLQLTANNLLSIQFADDGHGVEQGTRLWDGIKLAHLQDATNHYDTGYDLAGNPVFIATNNSSTLANLTNPCPSGWGLDVRQQSNFSAAICLLDKQPSWHVSYRGSSRQPWMAISFFDSRKEGPEMHSNDANYRAPTASDWMLYEDEIVLARIDGGATYRMAQARSRSAESFWAQPHAAISRDGKYVVFTSDMAYPNGCPQNMHVAGVCTDVYLIQVH
jgi:hypothetical protein